jgi:hypothetical protein
MKFLIAILILSSVSLCVQATNRNISIDIKNLVVEEVISNYSRGWDDDTLPISSDDIWALEYSKNNSSQCHATVTGFAKKPSYNGTSTVQFWICITKDSMNTYEASFLDDVQIADE